MRLDDLIPILGGHIREARGRRFLDTHVGGLRAFVICRSTLAGTAFDLAVLTPEMGTLDPFVSIPRGTWVLRDDPSVLPRLSNGIVFSGCQGGVLFGMSTGDATLESIVGALWDLAKWARLPWCPPAGDPDESVRLRREQYLRRFQRWFVVGIVVFLILRLVLG